MKIAAILFPLVLCLGLVGCDSKTNTELTFDPNAWKNAVGAQTELRNKMLRDLLAKHNIVGMSKHEVIELLGEPDRKDRFSSDSGESDFNYNLGPETGGFISIDSDWLTIKFKGDSAIEVLVTVD